MKSLFYLLLFIFLISCSKIDFVYEDNKNLTNPLYEKTIINTSGLNLTYLDSYLPMFFGKIVNSCIDPICPPKVSGAWGGIAALLSPQLAEGGHGLNYSASKPLLDVGVLK